MNAVSAVIRTAHMQNEQLDVIIDGFAKQADLTGKKFKSGEALTSTRKRIKDDDFITQFAPSLDEFSIEEINSLSKIFNSETMKKYNKVTMRLVPLWKAIQEAFLATPEELVT